tara:strand:- start:1892 stop:2029 length:138 start_codon:yes stop_codon:yes gene_type:complete
MEVLIMIALFMIVIVAMSSIGVAMVYGIIALMVNLAKKMEETHNV